MNMRRVLIILLVLYALLTASPALQHILGQPSMEILTLFITLTGFTFAILHASQREGWTRTLQLLALVFAVSLAFESVGVATGLVYGPYHYTEKLGPKFLGLVPYLIPVAWFMMSYPSFVIAERLVPSGWKHWQRLLSVAAVGGLVMTAWDLVMDPIMVASGHWVWFTNGAYFGIPLQNFWGWWLTVFCTYALYMLISGKADQAPEAGFDRLALVSYAITMLGITLPTFLYGSGNLGLIGLFAMLPWMVAGWLKLSTK